MPHGTDARLDEAYALLDGGGIALLSLDVFDTLVFRSVPEPEDAFAHVGLRLAEAGGLRPHLDAGVFAPLRAEAERRARAHHGGTGAEVTMPEIYAELGHVLAPDLSVARAVEIELAAEAERLLPDLDTVALVEHAAGLGIPVVCVSDTYLSEAELRRHVLAQLPDRDRPFARVYVSSATRRGKAGGLFASVPRDMGVAPEAMLHVGDNVVADVRAPERMGIHAVHYERRPRQLQAALDREHGYRAAVGRPPGDTDFGLTALRAKVVHRRERAELPASLRGHWAYGASHLGPAFAGFAEWIVERAAEEGFGTAHCLMREGRLLVPMVQAAAAAAGAEVEARPLWLSRHVCARATIFDGSREELAELLERRRRPTVAGLLSSLGVAPESAPSLAPVAEHRLIDPRLVDRVLGELASDPEIHGQIVAGAAAVRRRLLIGLEEAVALDKGRLLVVDLGWGATIQHLLGRLLAHAEIPCDLRGLYMVTHAGIHGRLLDGTQAEGYLGSAGIPVGAVDALVRSPEILEQVCMPDHGSQLGVDAEGGPVVPEPGPLSPQDAERDAAQKGILAFQRLWTTYRTALPHRFGPLPREARSQLLSMLVRATAAPTAEEAALFGGWLHDDNFGASSADEAMTSGPSVRAIRHLDAAGLLGIPMAELYWPFGLAALHDEQLGKAAELVALRLVDRSAFSSELETGPFECFGDAGDGFGAGPSASGTVGRNRFGLSHVRTTLQGAGIRAVRFDPVAASAIVRLDWLTLRTWRTDRPEPEVLRMDEAGGFGGVTLVNATWLDAGVVLSPGGDPQLVFDLTGAGGTIFQVELEAGFEVLPLAGRLREAPAEAVAAAPPPPPPARRILRAGVRRLRRLRAELTR